MFCLPVLCTEWIIGELGRIVLTPAFTGGIVTSWGVRCLVAMSFSCVGVLAYDSIIIMSLKTQWVEPFASHWQLYLYMFFLHNDGLYFMSQCHVFALFDSDEKSCVAPLPWQNLWSEIFLNVYDDNPHWVYSFQPPLNIHFLAGFGDLDRITRSHGDARWQNASCHFLGKFWSDQVESLWGCYRHWQDDAQTALRIRFCWPWPIFKVTGMFGSLTPPSPTPHARTHTHTRKISRF